ncbi:hypothetical protein [Spirosoma flavum]|uniref:Glycosyltransferase RgtA/B/C/D-like domain-containing protein n=1 Tax=Spirosoma flavum TaxID=2048557 RepID=A0ABW6ADR4_9BACT
MKDRLFDGLSLLLIIVAIYVLNHQLTTISDVQLGDEAFYMYQGISNFRLGLQTDWGPAYSLWYKFLSLFEPDTIRLYYLNMALLSSLPTIALYVALRFTGFRWYWALYCTLVFHFSRMNFPEGVKVSILLFLLTLLLFIIGARYLRDKLHIAFALLTLTYFLFAYFRPEFVVPFGVCLVLLIGATFWFRQSVYPIVGIVAVVLVLFFGVGSPLSEKGEKAFKQDFSYNYAMRHPEDKRLSTYSNWVDSEVMSQLIFGERVKGFGDALLKHPKLVIGDHLLPNVYNLSVQLLTVLGSYFQPLSHLPGATTIQSLFDRKITWVLLLIIFVGLVSIRQTARAVSHAVMANPWPYIVATTAIIAPIVSSVYSMGIKIRYLPAFYFFIPVVIGAMLMNLQFRPWLSNFLAARKPVIRIVGSALSIFFLLGIGAWMIWEWKHQTPATTKDKELLQYTKQLTASIADKNRIRIFDNPDALSTHLGSIAIGFDQYKRNTDFYKFVEQNDINLIIFRTEVTQYYENDSSMQRFIEQPPQAFIRTPGFDPNTYSFMRRDLLK